MLLYWISLVVLIQYMMIQSTEACCASRCCSGPPGRPKGPDCEGCECEDEPEPPHVWSPWSPHGPWPPRPPSDPYPRSIDQRIQGKFREDTNALINAYHCV